MRLSKEFAREQSYFILDLFSAYKIQRKSKKERERVHQSDRERAEKEVESSLTCGNTI